jgi:hypothetical protein
MLQTHLRLECLEFLVNHHRSFVPSTDIVMKTQEEKIPKNVIQGILVAHGHPIPDSQQGEGGGEKEEAKVAKTEDEEMEEAEESQNEKSGFGVKVNSLCLPESPVNEYGITLRAMRCLEVSVGNKRRRPLARYAYLGHFSYWCVLEQITESVCTLRDLMDYSMREKEKQLGPIGEFEHKIQ